MSENPERRELTFQNLGEVLAEAERLASGEVLRVENIRLVKS